MKKIILLNLALGLLAIQNQVHSQSYWPEDFIKEKATNQYTVIGSSSEGLDSPVDLDFNKKDLTELWVINMRTESVGGNTVTFQNVGTASQRAYLKKDGNSWHFMSLPTALAFGENGAWANSPGVWDANHRAGTTSPFTGPSLWSSDFSIYAQPSGGNGSHIDMLHGSPYSVGIAWERGNQYWLFDGHNGHVAMYDFAIDHGPGNADHDDGRIRRYPEISLKRLGLVPGHMEIDKVKKWLYVNDIGNKRIVRIDITSGNVKGTSSTPASERLAENLDMENVVWEVVASTGLDRPCGLDITKDRLIITDNGTSELIVYDISRSDGTFPELGRIKIPGFSDIMGVKLDDQGKIWFVDKTAKKVVRIDNENVKKREDDGAFVGMEELSDLNISFYPNPFTSKFSISGLNSNEYSLSIYNISGAEVYRKDQMTSEIDLSEFQSGLYFVHIIDQQGRIAHSEKLVKQ